MSSPDKVLDVMREVADEVINPRFRALAAGQVDEKTPGDYVTIADRESELLLAERLPRMFPGAVVIGEEATFADPSTLDHLRDEHVFLVDPVDGTRNFVRGSADHGVMVAELVRGEAVRAWVWQPQHGVAWTAEKGAGTWRTDQTGSTRVNCADSPRDRLPLGATSKASRRGFTAEERLSPTESSLWAVAIDYPQVIVGEWDYLVYKNIKPWDHVPCTLLLREAGGVATDFEGVDYAPTYMGPGLVAANSAEVAELVRETWLQP